MSPFLSFAVMAVVVVGIVAGISFGLSWWTWRPVTKRRVLVQTNDGASFDGALMSRRGPLLVLADVTVRAAAGEQRIDGIVIIERATVAFIQVVS